MDYDTWATMGSAHRCSDCGTTWYDSEYGCTACPEREDSILDRVEAYANKPVNGHYPTDEEVEAYEAELRDPGGW